MVTEHLSGNKADFSKLMSAKLRTMSSVAYLNFLKQKETSCYSFVAIPSTTWTSKTKSVEHISSDVHYLEYDVWFPVTAS